MTAIGIFEPTHETHLYNFCRILGARENRLTVFTTDEIAERVRQDLDADPHRWYRRGETGIRSFLTTVDRIASAELDVLLVNSFYGGVFDLLRARRFDPDCPTLFWVYNARAWVGESPSFNHGLVENINLLCRRRLRRRLAPLAVEYPPVATYVEEETDFEGEVYTLAPTLYDPEAAIAGDETDEDTLSVTVPGYVEESRRDYDVVLGAMAGLTGTAIQLTLLGRPKGEYGQRILREARRLDDVGLSVTCYDEWIPIEAFQRTLAGSDLLLCPLRESIASGLAEEIYGTTKGSGCVWDAIRSTTPLVVPEHFAVPDYLHDATLRYDDEASLQALLAELLASQERLQDLRSAAEKSAKNFSLTRQRQRYNTVISSLVDMD